MGPAGPLRRFKETQDDQENPKIGETRQTSEAVQTSQAGQARQAGHPHQADQTGDEYAKPRAARFAGGDPELLAKAAEAMHVRLVEVADSEVAEIAARLPAGRLHANGRGLVPYVKADLYSDLMFATLATKAPQPNPDPAPQDLPRTWDEVAPGHLVIARETFEIGWWEAVVVERNGDLVTVRYRDYPQYPNMVWHRSAIALISPAAQ